MGRLTELKDRFVAKVKSGIRSKKMGATGIIVSAILLVISVVLAITFKNSITGWLNSLITYFSGQLSNFTA